MRSPTTRTIVGMMLLTGIVMSGAKQAGLVSQRLAGQLTAAECTDGIDNDGDGKIDALSNLSPDPTATRTFGSLGRGAMNFIYTEMALFPYNDSQTIDDDVLTTQRVCQLAGFKTVQSVTKRNFSSCGDNLILYWNGSSWVSGSACSRDGFISTLVCVDRVSQCDNLKDDDFDGQIDMADGGCASATDTSEGFHDDQCTSASVPYESLRQCQDGIDNNGNGLIDYPADTGCDSALDNDENGSVVLNPSSPDVCSLAKVDAANLSQVAQMAKDAAGNLWLAAGTSIIRMSPSGATTQFPVSASGSYGANAIAVAADGNIWYNGVGKGKIGKMSPAGTMTTFAVPQETVWDITAGPDGNIWMTLASEFQTSIAKITAAGTVTEYAVRNGVTSTTARNRAIAAGADGFLYFGSERPNVITKISVTGTQTDIALTNATPEDVAAGPDGNIWFTDPLGYNIGKVTPSGIVKLYPVPQQSGRPVSLAKGADRMWFTTVSGREGGIGSIKPFGQAGVISAYYNQSYGGINVSKLFYFSSGVIADAGGNVWFSFDIGNTESWKLRQLAHVDQCVDAVVPASLVGHWDFDTATAASAPDSSGKNNVGTVVGATPIRGCMQFDGVDDRIDIPNMDREVFSFTAWAKKQNGGNGQPALIGSKGDGGWALAYGTGDNLNGTTGSQPLFLTKTGYSYAQFQGTVAPEEWHQIAMTYDGSTAKLYMDGVLASTKSYAELFVSNDVYSLGFRDLVGGTTAQKAAANSRFKGLMDDVRVYDGVLTDAEIAALMDTQPSCSDVPVLSCQAAEFDATKGSFAASGWTESIGSNATITGPLKDGTTTYYRIADNSTASSPNAYVPLPRDIIQDKDFVVEMRARIVSSSTGRTDLTGGNALILAPDGRYVALYFDTNKFGTIKNLAWSQTVNRNTSDAFHTYAIVYKKNGAGVSNDTFDVYFDGEKVLANVALTDVAYIPSQSSDALTVGAASTDGLSTMDVSYVRFSNAASPCVTYTTLCGVAEYYAGGGTEVAQGWSTVQDTDSATNLTGPFTDGGVSYVRLSDQSATSGLRTSKTDISNAMLSDRDWSLEMKSRTIASDPNGYVLGMNMLLATPNNVSTSLFIDSGKIGMQAATPNAYTWGPSVNRSTVDGFHTYIIKNKKNGAGASDDTIDVYFDGAKVLSDIARSQLYVYDPGTGVEGVSFGIGSSPGKGTMDVSYVKFKNDETTCPANPFKTVATQCSDGIDNDNDGKIDYATETEVLTKTWGPVSISPGGASVVAATGLQAGQFIKPTLATGGAVCESILGGHNIASYYFAGVFTDDAGTYIQASPPNAPASRSIPMVSDPAWPLDIFKVPNGATQLKVFMPAGITFTGTCTLSGKVFEMQRSSNWPGDLDCSSAADDTEIGDTCTDTDGGNDPLVKGFANATSGSLQTATDSCDVTGKLKEYFCDSSKNVQFALTTCDTGYSCVDGACKASASSAATVNTSRVGYGGVAFDGNDIIFMPLQNGDASYHGNVLSFGPVCKPGKCGDGVRSSDEQCDDGNAAGGDGCNEKCIWEPYASNVSLSSASSSSLSSSSASSVPAVCGDGKITAPEKCDDGNLRSLDGCSATCIIETGWSCTPRLP